VHRGGSYARYLPSGHLVFINAGTLFAAPFDLRELELTASPVPVLEEVADSLAEGGAQFDFTAAGLLAYVSGSSQVVHYPILWVDEHGGTSQLLPEPGAYAKPELSPDGKRLAFTMLREGNWDVWVYDVERGVSTRLTFDKSIESEQVWSPDGQWLILSSDKDGIDNLYRKRADGSGELERLTTADHPQWAQSWSRDGRYVALIDAPAGMDIAYLDLETKEVKPLLASTFNESNPSISPDGKWLAYDSTESGTISVYVRPFPTGEGKWQVSSERAVDPEWSADGSQLFWRNNEGIVAADVDTSGGTFRAGKVRQLFSGTFRGGLSGLGIGALNFTDYDVAPDGKRFVMFSDPERIGREGHSHVTLVTRWFDDVERATKTGK
jgi:serine/threonine-protein kinase